MKKLILILSLVFQSIYAFTQVNIVVNCDKDDWQYKIDEEITFSYQITSDNISLKNAEITYEIGEEKMPNQLKGRLDKLEGNIKNNKLSKSGFLRCTILVTVGNKTYKGLATAAIEPYNIKPTVSFPSDFKEFWNNSITETRKIPLNSKVKLIPEQSNEKVNVYAISFENDKINSRIHGILTVPTKSGKYPAVLEVPGAGIRKYSGNFELVDDEIITLQIGIHGIPVDLDQSVYSNLAAGALFEYPFINLDNKDYYYYKRVYLGCVKAVDFIYSLPEFDGENIAVSGGSQGGALAIVTASLEPRIKYLRCNYPALCDITGYLNNQAGGWPHLLNEKNKSRNYTDKKMETIPYFDVVNFARTLTQPGLYSWGYNDEVCPPTSIYAAYNVINAPKELFLVKETGHTVTPIQVQKKNEWLINKLKK